MEKITFTQEEHEFLKRLGVEALILFGSRALGLEKSDSDYDFGVLVRDENILTSERRRELHNALYDMLSEKMNQLVNIDIVFLKMAPLELQRHVMYHGIPLYAENRRTFARFKERVMIESADFAPYRDIFEQQVLSRVS